MNEEKKYVQLPPVVYVMLGLAVGTLMRISHQLDNFVNALAKALAK